jgi:hypothetical protein
MSTTVPPKFTPPVSDKLTPAEMAVHLRQLYLITNQHDQAIIQVNNKTSSSASSTATDIDTVGVTSFNSQTGIITFFPALGQVNNQTGLTAYTIQAADSGKALVFNDASPIAVTLDSTVGVPWTAVALNLGAGTATLTPTSGLINGSASLAIPGGGFAAVYFDGVNWWGSTAAATTGFSGTVALAKLTGGGTNGSITVVNGLVTAYTPPT